MDDAVRSLCEVLQHTINPDAAVRKACTLRCHCKGLMQCPFAVAVAPALPVHALTVVGGNVTRLAITVV